jgi:hypothetical protein
MNLARVRAVNWQVWVTAFLGASAYASCFFPGVMSFDSAYAWWQARGGETSDLQAPMMMRLWQLCDALLPGPGLLFLLHLCMFWCGLALIATRLRGNATTRIAFMLLVACSPVCFILFAHVWTDVALMAALTLAIGALWVFRDVGNMRWMWVAAVALFYALGVRFNALTAALPIVCYIAFLLLRRWRPAVAPAWTSVGGCTAIVIAVLSVPVAVINHRVDRYIPYTPILQLCDLAAISGMTDEMLVPEFALTPDTKPEFFRKAYQPWACLPLYAGTRAPVATWTGDELIGLRYAWFAAIQRHPVAYLRHRSALALAQIGTRNPDWPHEIVFIDSNYQYLDNPPISQNKTAAHALFEKWFAATWFTIWFATWPYLLLALITLIFAWNRRHVADMRISGAVASSALLYALPYFFIGSSAELRYLGWSCLAALIGAALAIYAPRPALTSAAYPPAL